jgi:FixJ family two-component response regulator
MSKTAAKRPTGPSIPLSAVEKALGVKLAVARARFDRLTPRETQVATMMADALQNRRIAEELGISVKTLDIHRANLTGKLEVRTAAAVANLVNLVRLAELAESAAG